jgi:hypothetical protein
MKTLMLILGLAFVASCSRSPGAAETYAAERAAIIDLQHRYVLAMDYFDADGYANVFAEDGVLDWAGGVVEGREAIREFMASGTYDLRTRGFQPATAPDGREWPSTVRHLITNQVVVVEGDTAKAITYWMNYANNANRAAIEWLSFGSWEDEYRKIDGKWYFTLHRIFNEGNPRTFTAGQPNPLTTFLAE